MFVLQSMPLKVIQINLGRSSSATSHLVNFISNNNNDFVLIQKPYATHPILSFSLFFRCCSFNLSTTIVISNPLIVASLVPHLSNDISTSVLIKIDRLKLIVNWTYFTSYNEIKNPLAIFQNIFDNCKLLLIDIDSNARSPCGPTDLRTREVNRPQTS